MWGNHRKAAVSSAALAKERLQVVITRERAIYGANSLKPELLDALRTEIISVIRKYADIRENDIRVHMERDADKEVLEVSVVFPD